MHHPKTSLQRIKYVVVMNGSRIRICVSMRLNWRVDIIYIHFRNTIFHKNVCKVHYIDEQKQLAMTLSHCWVSTKKKSLHWSKIMAHKRFRLSPKMTRKMSHHAGRQENGIKPLDKKQVSNVLTAVCGAYTAFVWSNSLLEFYIKTARYHDCRQIPMHCHHECQ